MPRAIPRRSDFSGPELRRLTRRSLAKIGTTVSPGKHAVLLSDQAGWGTAATAVLLQAAWRQRKIDGRRP